MPEVGGTYVLDLTVADGAAGTDATVLVVAPDGTTPAITPTDESDGNGTSWEAIVPVDQAGWWLSKWTVTGPGLGVKSKRFYVARTPTAFGVWPPCLTDLRNDAGKAADDQDDSDDGSLSMVLDAAITRVTYLKGDEYDLDDDPTGESDSGGIRIAPDFDLILGTIRLARRWHDRRRSPDGAAIMAGDLGTARVPAYDPDIERLLKIGRYARPQDGFA